MQIISREAAHNGGLTRFYTGTHCKHGHLAERYVSTGACVDCLIKRFKRYTNPYSRELVPLASHTLWVPVMDIEKMRKLETYLQSCVMEFVKWSGDMTPTLQEAFALQLEGMQREPSKGGV